MQVQNDSNDQRKKNVLCRNLEYSKHYVQQYQTVDRTEREIYEKSGKGRIELPPLLSDWTRICAA